MSGIALLVVQDGRTDYLTQAVASAAQHLHGPITERWVFDDSGDPSFRSWLSRHLPGFMQIHRPTRVGFDGAIRHAWEHLSAYSSADWVFHLEEDFLFNRPVDLTAMSEVLTDRPYLVQMALRRQAWSAAEHAAGGVVEVHPDAYTEINIAGRVWLQHRLFFTTNPSLYRRDLCTTTGWPTGPASEGRYTHGLLRDGMPGVPGPDIRFGYWGGRADPPWVTHIGIRRTGRGY